MRHYRGTEMVEPGLYLNLRQLSFKSLDEEGCLPGKVDEIYRRVPTLALLLVGPLMGLAFVVFLPLIAFVMVGWLLAVKTVHLAGDATRTAVRVLRPGWEPSLAFLSRSKPARTEGGKTDEWAKAAREKLDRADRDAA
jgi:hypothetical protein